MSKTLQEILNLVWEKQAEELHKLSRLELEVLFFELNRFCPSKENQDNFERFFLAVFSLIRDRREGRIP